MNTKFSTKPFLRIETGMHTDMIHQISADLHGRFLVTGSDDATVRLWELPSGSPIRVFRPPTYGNLEGRITAVAMAPDASLVACGGHTSNRVYFFNRESGAIVKTWRGLPFPITHLAFSQDGQYLAASLHDKGVRVFRLSDSSMISFDQSHCNRVIRTDWDQSGRLIFGGSSGILELYGSDFKLIARRHVSEGAWSAVFSLDGERVAVVSSADQAPPKIFVLSSRDLSLLYSPDLPPDVDMRGSVTSAVWSHDGRRLYWGYLDSSALPPGYAVVRWDDRGRGAQSVSWTKTGNITGLLPLADGSLAFAAIDPAFGILDSKGDAVLLKDAGIAKYWGMGQCFAVSEDGLSVRFSYKMSGADPAEFSVSSRVLKIADRGALDESLSPPIFDDEILSNGKLVFLRGRGDYAIAPDRKGILINAGAMLRFVDLGNNEIWRQSNGIRQIWAANISSDGRFALAAYADGTIRWYRLKDGKELLIFLPHNDRERWALWTPSGYYDASPGGEDLIGWHINTFPDQAAQFDPASRLRAKYYRPDVVSKVLVTLNEDEALRLGDLDKGAAQGGGER